MSFDFIKPDELNTSYRDALKFVAPLHEPFDEYERIARNRPHPGIAKELPKVTDGTLASIIQDKPKRIIQQIPTGKIETEDEWLEYVAQFILDNVILPNSQEEAAEIQKCWAAISKSMTYGSQPAFVKFLQNGDYFGTDFVLPYVKDVILEPGKISDRASNIMFLRSWWSKNQIRALIDSQKNLQRKAEDRGDTFETGWDLSKLADLLEEGTSQKDANAQNSFEKNKMLNQGFYELVHVFQKGIEGTFYTFSPKMEDGDNVLRKKTNPDPRGVIPIHYLYSDQDLNNPLGRGAAEMSGGMQNLLDSETQMYQLNRALGLNPPMKKWGTWSKANAKFVPNHIIELGMKTTGNDIEPFPIDTQALANFPQNVQLMQSQIMRLNQSGDTASISAEAGAVGMSKTPQGIKTRDAQLSISDNHTRKQFETWWSDLTETRLNLYFAERHGVQELTLDEETAFKLNKCQPNSVNEDNKIRIDYDSETPKLKFQVDASSSDMKDNATQLEALDGLLERYEKSPILQQIVPQDKIVAVWNGIISASGVEGPEKLSAEVGPDGQMKQDQNQQQPQMNPEMVQQMIEQAMQQNDANDPKNHPVARIMAALNIKGTDMDAETLRTLIAGMMTEMGIQPPAQPGPLPMEVNQNLQIADTHLKAQQQGHQQQVDAAKLHLEAVKTASSSAQVHNAHAQTHADNALKAAQFQQSSNQADRQHELAVQASKQGATNESA